jgi:hypothetical protein
MQYSAFIILILLAFYGCNFLEVKVDVAQRSIMDKGDNTKDEYIKLGDSKSADEKDEVTTVIKTIP